MRRIRFEYMIELKGRWSEIPNLLDEYGADGWQLVAVDEEWLWFMREQPAYINQ